MELSLRLDTLGMVEVRYLRGKSPPALPVLLAPLPALFLSLLPREKCSADSHSDRHWSLKCNEE